MVKHNMYIIETNVHRDKCAYSDTARTCVFVNARLQYNTVKCGILVV